MNKFFLIILFVLNAWRCSSQYENYLFEFLNYPSLSGNEYQAGEYLKNIAKENGLHTKILSEDSINKYNLAISLYPVSSQKPSIIFLNHLDVVPIADSSTWINKGVPLINDTMISGRGAIDAKGLAIMQLGGLIEFKRNLTKELPTNIVVLCVYGEEWQHENGAHELSSRYLKHLNPIAVYGEGGGGINQFFEEDASKSLFGISVNEKRALWLKISTSSNKDFAHGAVSNNLYANKKLIKGLIKLLDMKRKYIFSPTTKLMFKELSHNYKGLKRLIIRKINWYIFWPFVKKHFKENGKFNYLVNNTLVITQLNSNNSNINQTSDKAEAIIDVRLLPEISTEKYLAKIKSLLGKKFEIEVLYESPPSKASSTNNLYYQSLKKSLDKVYPNSTAIPILLPATTDNNYFRRLGIPTYGIIPCVLNLEQLRSIHGNNEYILKKQLNKGIEFYKMLLIELASYPSTN